MEERILKRAHRVAAVETYEVTADELDGIERGHSARQNDMAFLGISSSVFVSFALTLIAVLSNEKTASWTSQFYWAVTVTSGFGSAYFYHRWRSGVLRDAPVFQRIRERAIGPLGDEAREIKTPELATLEERSSAEKG